MASEQRCSAALLLDIDPVGLVRRGRGASGFALAEYVNDRPYVASSFLSVALVTVFKSAMAGRCKGHEELAASAVDLEASLPVVPVRGGEELVRRLFEPLGYELNVTAIALDPQLPDRGDGRHVTLTLRGELRLADLLRHLYVLLPVLDDDKHYWIDEAEIEKLMRRGEGWLVTHPERDLIVRRYLKKQAHLFHPAARGLDVAALAVAQRARIASTSSATPTPTAATSGRCGASTTCASRPSTCWPRTAASSSIASTRGTSSAATGSWPPIRGG